MPLSFGTYLRGCRATIQPIGSGDIAEHWLRRAAPSRRRGSCSGYGALMWVMRRSAIGIAALACAAVLVLLTLGCGSSKQSDVLSTPEVVASLRDAGFQSVSVYSNAKTTREVATLNPAIDPSDAADFDVITSPASSPANLFIPILVVRMPSSSEAAHTYKNGYSPAAVAAQLAEVTAKPKLYAGFLPKGFRPSALRTALVCNVVLASYNARRDSLLDQRVQRVLTTLRGKCQ